MPFPTTRLRRLRQNDRLRNLVRETRLTPANLIYPLFVCPGKGVRKEIRSMPGVFNLSVDQAVKEAEAARALGIQAIIFFGLPESKDEQASGAWIDDGIVQQATRAIKREVKDLLVIGDVCLCEYMSHGHCGVVKRATTNTSKSVSKKSGAAAAAPAQDAEYEIVNDASVEILAKTSVSLAKAGIDIIAPSDMMDGRVAAIRSALDESRQREHAYPFLRGEVRFRVLRSIPRGCRFRARIRRPPHLSDGWRQPARGHARDRERPRRRRGHDHGEARDALPRRDRAARERFNAPLAAYQVSGEYAMIQAAAKNGWVDGERVMMESLTSIKRAGADLILTYFAKDAAKLLA
jgi:porphobilinogen synthase